MKYALPLFFLVVKRNVSYTVVATFLVQEGNVHCIGEAVEIFKGWNPCVSPKYFMSDCSDAQIGSVNTVFPGSILYICDSHRCQAWQRWVRKSGNGLSPLEHKDLLDRLRCLANADDVGQINEALHDLQCSQVWEQKKVQEYMNSYSLPRQERWMRCYRQTTYHAIIKTNNGVEAQNKILKHSYLASHCDNLPDRAILFDNEQAVLVNVLSDILDTNASDDNLAVEIASEDKKLLGTSHAVLDDVVAYLSEEHYLAQFCHENGDDTDCEEIEQAERASRNSVESFFEEVLTFLTHFERVARQNDHWRNVNSESTSGSRLREFLAQSRTLLTQIGRVRENLHGQPQLGAHCEAFESALSRVYNDLSSRLYPMSGTGPPTATDQSDRLNTESRAETEQPSEMCPRVSSGFRGPPRYAIGAEQLTQLRRIGYPLSEVARQGLLTTTSRTTLYRHIRRHNLPTVRQEYSSISNANLEAQVRNINRQYPNSGSQEVRAHLRGLAHPIIVQRERVRRAVRVVDPVGTASRWAQVIHRRRYSVPGPNSLWHLDTNHALRRWRIIINGGIDGFSRLVVYLHAQGNNNARSSLYCFLGAIRDYSVPSRIRTDEGGEFVHVRTFMSRQEGEGRGSAIAGRSVHNVRIERLWRDVYSKVLDTYYRLFYHMESFNILDVSNVNHMFALHHTFIPRIERHLRDWAAAHNNHPVRTENHRTPLQLWFGGLVQRAGMSSRAVTNVFDAHLPDADNLFQQFGIEWNLEDPPSIVTVPSVQCPLSTQQVEQLHGQVDVLRASESEGMDIYAQVLRCIDTFYVRE
ncbi:PREDICTED: uncharacterized protein LOC106814853 [Priapulus caudatus]|uniref:Uncharacterized protein LOC106814853 n=1 Tax=Priapulus caudatus TaxID=37621 RepID=A0ABM1ER82_PRICU|nr:PREDICTED: uncharacterized protein LOC106814853 [Priapulus caudatus]